jgi:hypothetical protein
VNIDILNIGHYRLTSHGGRSYDLFDRNSGKVYTLNKSEHDYIRVTLPVGEQDMMARCRDVISWMKK